MKEYSFGDSIYNSINILQYVFASCKDLEFYYLKL